jgi:hypothetical protein
MMAVNRSLIVLFFLPLVAYSQSADTIQHINKKRLNTLIIGSSVAYGITLVGLNKLWYEDSPTESFHFFNDNAEWKQVDKVGHFFSTYYFSYGTSQALRWCNVKPKKSDLIGSLVGFGVMLPIEIMDGFSSSYGASAGDLVANAAGSPSFWDRRCFGKNKEFFQSFHFTELNMRRCVLPC